MDTQETGILEKQEWAFQERVLEGLGRATLATIHSGAKPGEGEGMGDLVVGTGLGHPMSCTCPHPSILRLPPIKHF
jgi:hypothetical protein